MSWQKAGTDHESAAAICHPAAMLRSTLAMIVLAGLTATAHSSPHEAPHFGARIGLDVATLDVPGAGDALDHRSGLWLGGFVMIPIVPNFAIEPAIGYAQKGAVLKPDPIFGGGGKIRLDYIAVPIVAVGRIPVDPKLHLRGFLGPGFNFRVNAKTDDTIVGTLDVKDSIKAFDFSLVLGIGIDITLASGMFVFDVRFEDGLSDINDDPNNPSELKHRVFTLEGGYAF
jgi:hypothetical protein